VRCWSFLGKFDICCSLSIQSPLCVFVGWMIGQKMDLSFQLFETTILFVTIPVVAFLLKVGP
jgi:Ca2+/H+ antiporter